MKKIIRYILTSFIFFFLFNLNVYANSISNISMDVLLDRSGDAYITEEWTANLTEGTEGYRSFSDLDGKEIIDFSVIDDTNTVYTDNTPWNVNSSFLAKKYKSGINYTNNGLELCWGISNYGYRKYTLKYTIKNFVTQYNDKQAVGFNMLDLKQNIDSANIVFHIDDYELNKENSKIWAFGYDGNINFSNGNIVMTTNRSLDNNDYMSVLIKFEEDIFTPSIKSEKSFNDLYKKGMKGVKLRERNKIIGIIISILSILIPLLLFIFIFSIIYYETKKKELYFGKNGNKLPKDIHYFREIPADKSILKFYLLAKNYGINKKVDSSKGMIGAYFLKWVRDDLIFVREKDNTKLFNKNEFSLDVTNLVPNDNMDNCEKELLTMVTKAAKDNLLESKEFTKYCKDHYNKINSWIESLDEEAIDLYKKDNLITEEKRPIRLFLWIKKNTLVKCVNLKLKDEAIKVAGLKKYLKEFGSIPDKKAIEVKLWEEYLMFASILEIAKQVNKEFKKLYPDLAGINAEFNDAIIVMSNNSYSSYRSSYNSHNYSTGSGGSSFSSGGSFGGSSGGGFR